MKAFSEWYFGAVSPGLERGLVLLGVLSCVSCPDKSDFTFNLRVSPGLRSSEVPASPYPARPNLPILRRLRSTHPPPHGAAAPHFYFIFLHTLLISPFLHPNNVRGPPPPRKASCLCAAGRYSSSRRHTEAIWQSDRRVTRLTTKVVCNSERSS